MTVYRLLDGQAGRPGVGSSGTQPPAVNADTGNFIGATLFQVTANGLWLTGFESWVAANGDTTARKYALQQPTNTDHSVTDIVVPGSAVTSGTLARGAVNTVSLAAPIGLSGSVVYAAADGWSMTAGFEISQNQFASGQPYAAGIISGPLKAYSDRTGSAATPSNIPWPQGLFTTRGADPTVTLLASTDSFNSSLFWVGPVVSDVAPQGAVYELFPSQPYPITWELDTADNFTLGVQIGLSKPCALRWIRYYSPATVTQLATECGVWDMGTQAVITSTHVTSPSWTDINGSAAAAGAGFVYCRYSPPYPVLPAGNFKPSVFNGASVPAIWNAETSDYWSSGPGGSAISNGPVSAPGVSTATAPGQSTYHLGTTFHYPDTFASVSAGANYWVDVGVQPVSGGGLLIASGIV